MSGLPFGPARPLPDTGPDALAFPPEVALGVVVQHVARSRACLGMVVVTTGCGGPCPRWRPLEIRRGVRLPVPLVFAVRVADA